MGQIHNIGQTYKHKNGDFFILVELAGEPDKAVLISMTDGGVWCDPQEANCSGNYIGDWDFDDVAGGKAADFKQVKNPIRQARKRLADNKKKLETDGDKISRAFRRQIQVELQEILDEREKQEDQG
jgi:hypothetical protein